MRNRCTIGAGAAVSLLAFGGVAIRAAGETVRFQTTDDLEIVGDYLPALASTHPAPVVILLHMYGSDRSSWAPLIKPLHDAGFATLAIDLRGHGESGAPRTEALREMIQGGASKVFRDMWLDVDGARRWLAARTDIDQARVGIVGASVGCSVAFNYAIKDVSIDVIVAMSPGSGYFGVDSTIPMRLMGTRPVLLLATDHERQACDKLAELHSGATKRILGKMTAHGTRMFQALDGVEAMIVAFLNSGVGPRSSAPVVSVQGSGVYYDSLEAMSADGADADRANLRWFSSSREAEERGVRRVRED